MEWEMEVDTVTYTYKKELGNGRRLLLDNTNTWWWVLTYCPPNRPFMHVGNFTTKEEAFEVAKDFNYVKFELDRRLREY